MTSPILLSNLTPIPDAAIRPIVVRAKRVMGLSEPVPVKITTGRSLDVKGWAYDGWCFDGWLRGKRRKNERLVNLENGEGFVHLVVPNPGYVATRPDAADCSKRIAASIEEVARHELAHVFQYRRGSISDEFRGYGPGGKRRRKHGQRPIEVEARDMVYDTNPRTKAERERVADLTARLASAYEGRS